MRPRPAHDSALALRPSSRSTGPMVERGMRAEVADSWHRSAAAGVRVDAVDAPITLPADALRDYREAHPLARVFPILDDVLGQAARDCDAVMAVSDAAGQLLWVAGRPHVLRAAESIGFVEGSNWDERVAGTNAPGMALALDRTATVVGSEHFRRSVRSWSCAATPIHDPTTSSLLGVLDVTGGTEVAGPQAIAMVRAAARMAEAELARLALSGRSEPDPHRGSGMRLLVESLGRSESLLSVDDGRSRPTTVRLSRRHSEILLLLASAERGLSGDELAVLLYEDDSGDSTLRAEMKRLRNLLTDDLLGSPAVSAHRIGRRGLAGRRGDDRGRGRRGRDACLPRPAPAALGRSRGGPPSGRDRAVAAAGRAPVGQP